MARRTTVAMLVKAKFRDNTWFAVRAFFLPDDTYWIPPCQPFPGGAFLNKWECIPMGDKGALEAHQDRESKRYIKRIKNPRRKKFAIAYARYLRDGEKTGVGPKRPREISFDAWWNTRMYLREIYWADRNGP